MLVLNRKPHQCVQIGDNIEVVVIAVQGKRVKLGVRAPGGIPVLRHELCERREQAAAPKLREIPAD